MALQSPSGNAPIAMKQIRLADIAVGLTGLVAAAASLWVVPGVGGFLGAGLALFMLAIAVVDFRHMIIPDALSAAALALAIVNAALVESPSMVESIAAAALRGAVTMLLFLALRWTYAWLRRREGLGLGDVKLAFVGGAWLDWLMIPVAIEIAALAALVAYVAWRLVVKRPIDAAARLPFGLFLAPAIWLSWLLAAVLFGPA
jgi:leader peptidase (prepilin peptidase) / N-methyltransferase